MDIRGVWPFFVCIVLILLVAGSSLCRWADAPPSPVAARVTTIDGLRGFLALAVVFHHAVIYHRWLMGGGWVRPPSRFYDMLGPAGVSLFFMVTGYLFWGRMIDEQGRPHWVGLYIGRMFRIGPVYLAAVAIMAIAVFAGADWRPHLEATTLLGQFGTVMTLGSMALPPINGDPDSGLLLAGVTWTLHCEWLFYLSLPVTALAARRGGIHLAFVALALPTCLALSIVYPQSSIFLGLHFCVLFLIGMTCASLRRVGLVPPVDARLASAIIVVALVLTVLKTDIFTTREGVLLGAVFYLVESGGTLWGLLNSRAAQRLGNISYGLYLLQGLALAAVMRPHWARHAIAANAAWFWALTLAAALLLVAMAMLAHVTLERPGIALGRRVGRGLRRMRGVGVAA